MVLRLRVFMPIMLCVMSMWMHAVRASAVTFLRTTQQVCTQLEIELFIRAEQYNQLLGMQQRSGGPKVQAYEYFPALAYDNEPMNKEGVTLTEQQLLREYLDALIADIAEKRQTTTEGESGELDPFQKKIASFAARPSEDRAARLATMRLHLDRARQLLEPHEQELLRASAEAIGEITPMLPYIGRKVVERARQIARIRAASLESVLQESREQAAAALSKQFTQAATQAEQRGEQDVAQVLRVLSSQVAQAAERSVMQVLAPFAPLVKKSDAPKQVDAHEQEIVSEETTGARQERIQEEQSARDKYVFQKPIAGKTEQNFLPEPIVTPSRSQEVALSAEELERRMWEYAYQFVSDGARCYRSPDAHERDENDPSGRTKAAVCVSRKYAAFVDAMAALADRSGRVKKIQVEKDKPQGWLGAVSSFFTDPYTPEFRMLCRGYAASAVSGMLAINRRAGTIESLPGFNDFFRSYAQREFKDMPRITERESVSAAFEYMREHRDDFTLTDEQLAPAAEPGERVEREGALTPAALQPFAETTFNLEGTDARLWRCAYDFVITAERSNAYSIGRETEEERRSDLERNWYAYLKAASGLEEPALGQKISGVLIYEERPGLLWGTNIVFTDDFKFLCALYANSAWTQVAEFEKKLSSLREFRSASDIVKSFIEGRCKEYEPVARGAMQKLSITYDQNYVLASKNVRVATFLAYMMQNKEFARLHPRLDVDTIRKEKIPDTTLKQLKEL